MLPQALEQVFLVNLSKYQSIECKSGLQAIVLGRVPARREEWHVSSDPDCIVRVSTLIDPVREKTMFVLLQVIAGMNPGKDDWPWVPVARGTAGPHGRVGERPISRNRLPYSQAISPVESAFTLL